MFPPIVDFFHYPILLMLGKMAEDSNLVVGDTFEIRIPLPRAPAFRTKSGHAAFRDPESGRLWFYQGLADNPILRRFGYPLECYASGSYRHERGNKIYQFDVAQSLDFVTIKCFVHSQVVGGARLLDYAWYTEMTSYFLCIYTARLEVRNRMLAGFLENGWFQNLIVLLGRIAARAPGISVVVTQIENLLVPHFSGQLAAWGLNRSPNMPLVAVLMSRLNLAIRLRTVVTLLEVVTRLPTPDRFIALRELPCEFVAPKGFLGKCTLLATKFLKKGSAEFSETAEETLRVNIRNLLVAEKLDNENLDVLVESLRIFSQVRAVELSRVAQGSYALRGTRQA
jgi:hypothetical protein